VRIKYKSSIYGMSHTCKARPTVKVGSMSCEECEYYRKKAFGFIGKETTVGGRKIDLYGGWVECAALRRKMNRMKNESNNQNINRRQARQ
jgi:hypothetical protein